MTDATAERELLAGGDRRTRIADLAPVADPATLLDWQREAAALHVAPALLDYVQALLAASRGHATGAGTAEGSGEAGGATSTSSSAWAALDTRTAARMRCSSAGSRVQAVTM